ncbi:hypothetical protein CFB3_45650 [Clostridium folliculivorans]|uniref:Uncharacterized protein n=1 Tax=Clostridium folliculivorans TaxID=2886038 RepID=A0A9W5Y6X0_9CLOT|nr:hypothetical protein CFOLD11_45240 [Clostridium folliculivorans]GKU32457.1 hypothetical protein CFB3_45650 [Clostridium folliculivorans]
MNNGIFIYINEARYMITILVLKAIKKSSLPLPANLVIKYHIAYDIKNKLEKYSLLYPTNAFTNMLNNNNNITNFLSKFNPIVPAINVRNTSAAIMDKIILVSVKLKKFIYDILKNKKDTIKLFIFALIQATICKALLFYNSLYIKCPTITLLSIGVHR